MFMRGVGLTRATLRRRPVIGIDMKARISEAIPAGRYGRDDEAAAVITYLLSAEGSFVNGAMYTVDGGTTA
jgi:NAD(P)-dependent dehydrogenase (short-subunit alcohol dehydrogenase family)